MTLKRCCFPILALLPAIFPLEKIAGAEPKIEQEFILRNWDTEEGLPSSNLSALAKTADGYLWIGTASGLVRYDGFRFTTFNPANTPALPDVMVSSLLTDGAGALWIGTGGGGLVKFATNHFDRIVLNTNFPKAAVIGLAEDRSGVIWGTLAYAGVFSFNAGKTVFYNTNSGLPSERDWNLTVDNRGELWVISRWHLMHFDGQSWRDAGLPPDFPRVTAITPRHEGGLWIACVATTGSASGDGGTRIFKFENGRLEEDSFAVPWSQDSHRTLSFFLMEDRQGRLWCATRQSGIFIRDGEKWQLFSEASELSEVQATCAMEDEDSGLWFGMDGTGLNQLRPKSVFALRSPSGTVPSSFLTVYPGSDGSIWGGTDSDGIFRWKNGVVTHFDRQQGLVDEHVNAIIEDRNKNIWAGTMSGLFILKGAGFESVTNVETLRLSVFALKEDRAGQIWVGTQNGLVKIGTQTTKVFGQAQGIPFGDIKAIEEDASGRIWVAIPPFRVANSPGPVGPYGLFAQSGGKFEHIAEGQWQGEISIRSLQADADGSLWIGTVGNGFYRLHDGKFTEFSLADGIPSDRIQSVVADDAGNLWFCSELGIFGSPAAQLKNYSRGQDARINWWQIQRNDGLPYKSTTGDGQPSAIRDRDGRIWCADGNVIAGFDPKLVTKAARLRPPLIEEVIVNGVSWFSTSTGRIRLDSGNRRVEIHFTSPNTASPNLPTFWIRLKGFDPDWVNGGNTRVASYNLHPGNYEFSVAVAGPDGSRIETASPLKIEVVPTFLERTSVRFIAGLLLVAGISFSVWRWEKARSQRRLHQLEIQRALDQSRQRIARDIHDDLGSGLTEIILLSDNLRADGNVRNIFENAVQRIGARARSLTHEIDEVVWAINPRTDTLEALVTYLNDFAQERLALAGIRCRLNTSLELPDLKLPADIRHNLYRAAKEALNNAIKHAHPAEVIITIEPRGNNLLFIIRDDGHGFDMQPQLKRGNGLENMRQRLAEIGGSCEIQSSPGSGTAICFTIPISARAPRSSTNGHHAKS